MTIKQLQSMIYKHSFWSVIVLVLLSYTFIDPFGNYPINDDWAYARSVYNLNNGSLAFSDWQAPALIVQTLWATLWTKVFGFSHTILRVSTIILAVIGFFYFYKTLKLSSVSNQSRFWLLLALCFNPLWYFLSLSFMTDIPALVMLIIAIYHYIKPNQQIYLTFLFLIFGVLIRQHIIVCGLGLSVHYWLNHKDHKWRAILFTFLPLMALLAYEWLLDLYQLIPKDFANQQGTIMDKLTNIPGIEELKRFSVHAYNLLIFLGLAILPLTISKWKYLKCLNRTQILAGTTLNLLTIGKIITGKRMLPFTGDLLYSGGFGPIIEHDVATHLENEFSIPLIIIASLLSFLGITSLIILIRIIQKQKRTVIYWILGAFFVFHAILSINYLSDRYYLTFLPILIILIAYSKIEINPLSKLIISVISIVTVIFSTDYFNHRDARQLGIQHLLDQSIPHHHIEGGFEYNHWNFFDDPNLIKDETGVKWSSVTDFKYIVSSVIVNEGKVIKSFDFYHFASLSHKKMYIQKVESLILE